MISDESLSRNFRALSHPRRAMVFRLIVADPSVADSLDSLILATRLRPSSLVHHLREMERCGLLRRQRRGSIVAYRVVPGEFTTALAAALRLAEAVRARPACAA